MKAVAYTIDGSAVPVQALRDAGEKIAIRNIRFFDGVEAFEVVGLEVEDERIRAAYEAVGANVAVIPSIDNVFGLIPADEKALVPDLAPASEIVVEAPVVEKAPEPEVVQEAIAEAPVTKTPEDVTPPAPKAGKRK